MNTDLIYGVEEHIYNALRLLKDGKEALLSETEIGDINKLRDQGLLETKRPIRMKHPLSDRMGYYLSKKIEGISLQVTQDCNFRCHYCPYSQGENSSTRKHAKRSMPFEIAKKGIDFIQCRSRDAEKVRISFYGGEPLLEFELIRKIVSYSKNVFEGKPVSYNLTTNGSLLTREKIDYFEENGIQLAISLDGPKEIHDASRVLAETGGGTFDTIMKKVLLLEKEYPRYLRNKVIFISIIDPSRDFDCVNSLFFNHAALKDVAVVTSVVDDSNSTEKNRLSPQFLIQQEYDAFKAFATRLGWMERDRLSSITLHKMDNLVSFERTYGTHSIYDEMSHGGPCIIGAGKLFMDVDGNFFPCERVNETNGAMRIGNVKDGFDMQKVDKLLNVCQLTEDMCKDCWAINNCAICPKNIDDETGLSIEAKVALCADEKLRVEQLMRGYIAEKEILERCMA
ncbi:MAG: radical SAM protein [Clostridiales bacterium]|nr:radical SAM protein [Clostridiales bacterium]